MATQPLALRFSNSQRRLLKLARNYAYYVSQHQKGACNLDLIDNAAEALESHAITYGQLAARVNNLQTIPASTEVK